ncbi:SHOCT domain-containing protein [Jiangella aurantiaca]|uniref:SHOCT domain-containing protein n=1 Tax=Jiangella aurantiaca TaxID=2530373 RepID=A0A4R5AIA9_9ACTN|nr:SHOCT domain-containing protein [Jiangella aurantiaca]TDD71210.1 SHOCT domain-containing protein [Jiangella aurantiaca]
MDDYPLMNLFLTMIWFFLFVAWISMLVSLLGDIFRSRDLSGWGKALWTLLIIVLPILGALIYIVARGEGMTARTLEDYERREREFDSYVRSVAADSRPSGADELAKLARLRDAGTITTTEFEGQKAKLLA